MINILPSELKRQIKFSRYNVIALRYIFYVALIALVTGGTLGVSHWYADQQISDYKQNLQTKDAEAGEYQELESSIQAFNQKTETVRSLLDQRPRFSVLLGDIANVLPQGSYLRGITLNEEIDQPVELNVVVPSQSEAVSIRDALLQSPRITSADIQNISQDDSSDEVNVHVIITFSAGNGSGGDTNGSSESDSETDNTDGADNGSNNTGDASGGAS